MNNSLTTLNNQLQSGAQPWYFPTVPDNTPLQQPSSMTIPEVIMLMNAYAANMKVALEMGRSVRQDEIKQLRAENERLRLLLKAKKGKEDVHHD